MTTTGAHGLLVEGDHLAGRYRLQRPITPPGADVAGWLAYDETLARPVVLRAVAARDARSGPLLAAAARVGAIDEGGLTRVFDAVSESRPDRAQVSYTLREWVEGQPVDEVVGSDPLLPALALSLAIDATAGLVALHAAGLVHGAVHPGNVLVDELGRARLSDAGLALAVHPVAGSLADPVLVASGLPAVSPRVSGPGGVHERTGRRRDEGRDVRETNGRQLDQERDVRDLACVLHALVTARWPVGATAQPGGRLAAGLVESASPRQVRAGVPRAVDAVVVRVLEPSRRPGERAIRTAAQLLAALENAADEVGREIRAAAPAGPRERGAARRLARYVLVLAVLALVAVIAYGIGLRVGEIPATATGDSLGAPSPGLAAPSRSVRHNGDP